MTSLVLGWIGEPLAAKCSFLHFNGWGLHSLKLSWCLIRRCIALITAVHIVVGEQAPKVLAIQKSRETILLVSSPMRIFFFLFKPIIALLNSSSNGLLRLIGIKASTDSELAHTEENSV